MKVKATGIKAAQDAINAAIKDVNIESEEMLAVMLQSIAANTMPYVPVEDSNLLNSEYRATRSTARGPEGEIGYGAYYAPYVHAASGKMRGTPRSSGKGRYWDNFGGGGSAQPQFLLRGVQDFIQDDLSRIIQAYTP